MGLSQKLKNTVKTIFMNYLEFHNTKLEMNLEKVNRGCLKMVKILSSASFFLKKEKTEIKSRQNGIIEL